MSTQSRLTLGVLMLLLQVGCAAHKLYKQGQELAEAGSEYRAANKYLEALDQKEGYGKAKEALEAIAESGYEEKRQSASQLEGARDFAGALKEYQALDRYLGRLEARDVLTFHPIDVKSKIAEMQSSAAEAEYQAAERDLAARAWSDAIGHYDAAQGFKAAYKDTVSKTAQAWFMWGEDTLAQKAWRQAAERYAHSASAGGQAPPQAAARGGAIYAALGVHFLGADRCRQAVRDLRAAGELLGASAVAGDLERASDCAVTPVAILPFENPTGVSVAGLALGDALADQIGAQVTQGGSEFIRLLERSSLDKLLAEQGLTTSGISGATSPKRLQGVRYLVLGKLTQVRLEVPNPTVTSRTTSGKVPYKCTKTASSGKTYEGTCYNDVVVSYREHAARESLTVAGSVRVVDVKTGEQLAAPALTASIQDSSGWADAFTVNGNPVTVGSDGVQVDSDVVKLASGKQTLTDEGVLASTVLSKLSSDAARAVLEAVDVERPATDPATLPLSFAAR